METPMLTVSGRRAAASAVLVVLSLVSVACTRAVGATASAEASFPAPVSAGADAQATPSDCLTVHVGSAYGEPTSLNGFHAAGVAAIVGTLGSIGNARWNTPNQSRPADVRRTSAVPLRPLTVSGPDIVVGNPNPQRLVLQGGTVGCDTMTFESVESIKLVEGQKYVFIVFQLDYGSGPSGDWSLAAAWPMGDNGLVATSVDGNLTIGDIKQGLRDGWPEATPLPEPSGGG
jgi:hypothetical protein